MFDSKLIKENKRLKGEVSILRQRLAPLEMTSVLRGLGGKQTGEYIKANCIFCLASGSCKLKANTDRQVDSLESLWVEDHLGPKILRWPNGDRITYPQLKLKNCETLAGMCVMFRVDAAEVVEG